MTLNPLFMEYIIHPPQRLQATIDLPASKSISNRALIIQALTPGAPAPENLSVCDDTRTVVEALRTLPSTIDIGAAGTAMRFLTAYLAITPGEHLLTGSQRMQQRPIGPLVDALRLLGADITYKGEEGFPPLHITGQPLRGGEIEMEGSVSSQFVTALLLIAPSMERGLILHLHGLITSRPYIDMTLQVMQYYGAQAEWVDESTLRVAPQPYSPVSYTVENDWTSASYWYELATIMGREDTTLQLDGLLPHSPQGDAAVKYIFSLLGIRTQFSPSTAGTPSRAQLHFRRMRLPLLEYDFTGQPDLAQSVAATCVALGTRFRFTGLSTLRLKETDRLEALVQEMHKLGFVLQATPDDALIWDGTQCTPTPCHVIETYNDHRMALAFAPLAIRFPGLRIRHPEVVTKSYPRYWDQMRRAGCTITPIAES